MTATEVERALQCLLAINRGSLTDEQRREHTAALVRLLRAKRAQRP